MSTTVLSLYDGMAGGGIALKSLGIDVESYDAYEIDKYALRVAKHNFPNINEHGDVFKGDFTQYEGVDWLIGGSPCFVAGTMVVTYEGVKPIESVKVGDKVLTHKGRYMPVTEIMQHTADTVLIKAENCGVVECTKEHPFYIKEVCREWDAEKKQYHRVPNKDFEWTPPVMFNTTRNTCNTIQKETYLVSVADDIKEVPCYEGVSIAVNQHHTKNRCTLNINDRALWYVIGRWVGDGWFTYKYKLNGKKLAGIKICCGKEETQYLASKIDSAKLPFTLTHEATVDKFQISNVELATYLQQFGEKATGKHLPGFVTRLTDELAMAFLSGYLEADGHMEDYIGSYSTVSKELAYGIKYMINKYMCTSCSIKMSSSPSVIEGRKCHTNSIYNAVFHCEQRPQAHYIQEGQYILAPYKSVSYVGNDTIVYNLSVEEDESYTANGLAVHNCTYWSIAQSPDKRETTSSGMGWDLFCQYIRARDEAKPKIFLYENNKSMSKEIRKAICGTFGFEPFEINSALVSAQNRQRLYWVGIRQEDGTYRRANIPMPEDRGILLKDILETGEE